MNVFISYGDLADQVIALRLQALAAVNGMTVFVPPAWTRNPSRDLVSPEVELKLKESDVVLGVVANGFAPACGAELDTGLLLGKQVIVMAYPLWDGQLPRFGDNLIIVDPTQAAAAEHEIVRHLKALDGKKNTDGALLALATLALGMLLFASATSKQR